MYNEYKDKNALAGPNKEVKEVNFMINEEIRENKIKSL